MKLHMTDMKRFLRPELHDRLLTEQRERRSGWYAVVYGVIVIILVTSPAWSAWIDRTLDAWALERVATRSNH